MIIRSTAILILALFCNAPVLGAPSKQVIFKTNLLSIVKIAAIGTKYNGDIEPSYGSGFAIDEDGLIITSNHILPKDLDLYKKVDLLAYFTIESGVAKSSFTILARNKEMDLALLKLDKPVSPTCCKPILLGSEKTVEPGSNVYFIGYPGGLSNVAITPGLISSLHGPTGWWQLSSNMNEGNSGSPVFDDRGLCIGIAAAGLTQVEIQGKSIEIFGVNFIIPIERAVKAISTNTRIYEEYPEGSKIAMIAPGDIVRKAVPGFENIAPKSGTITDSITADIKKSAPKTIFGLPFDFSISTTGIIANAPKLNDFARSSSEAVRRDLSRSGSDIVSSETRQTVNADDGFKIVGVTVSNGIAGQYSASDLKISADGNSATFMMPRDVITSKILNKDVIVIEQIAK